MFSNLDESCITCFYPDKFNEQFVGGLVLPNDIQCTPPLS